MPAWSDMWSAATSGNFRDALGYAYLDSDELERGRQADAELQRLARQNFDRGVYSEAQLERTLARLEAADTTTYAGQVADDFAAGAGEGLATMQRSVKSTINSTAGGILGGILGFIPWWVWPLALLWVLWQLGLLKKVFTKAA